MRSARIILADPPWEYRNRHAVRHDGAKTSFGIGVAARYSRGIMTARDIADLPVAPICATDAYLFLWTTGTHMAEALGVMESWGFTYKTIGFVWVKTYPVSGALFYGTGRYVPANAELVLFGVRGSPWNPATGHKPCQVVQCPHPRDERRKIIHSRKPAAIHEAIEQWLDPHLGDHEKVELFATQARPGWRCLGYDVTGRDIRDDLRGYACRVHGHQADLFEGVM